jgi:hypothetical protein
MKGLIKPKLILRDVKRQGAEAIPQGIGQGSIDQEVPIGDATAAGHMIAHGLQQCRHVLSTHVLEYVAEVGFGKGFRRRLLNLVLDCPSFDLDPIQQQSELLIVLRAHIVRAQGRLDGLAEKEIVHVVIAKEGVAAQEIDHSFVEHIANIFFRYIAILSRIPAIFSQGLAKGLAEFTGEDRVFDAGEKLARYGLVFLIEAVLEFLGVRHLYEIFLGEFPKESIQSTFRNQTRLEYAGIILPEFIKRRYDISLNFFIKDLPLGRPQKTEELQKFFVGDPWNGRYFQGKNGVLSWTEIAGHQLLGTF